MVLAARSRQVTTGKAPVDTPTLQNLQKQQTLHLKQRITLMVNQYEVLASDAAGNVVVGKDVTAKPGVLLRDAEGLVVVPNSGRLVAALGVRDLIIVDTPDAVLVCPRERAQEVKDLVEELKETGELGYI